MYNIMVIREEKKMLKGKKLTKSEKEDFRRKKLVEVRKGKGPGRPTQMRAKTKGTFNNPKTQQFMNELRDKEIEALKKRMEEFKKVCESKNFN
jgi:hypothetical protein